MKTSRTPWSVDKIKGALFRAPVSNVCDYTQPQVLVQPVLQVQVGVQVQPLLPPMVQPPQEKMMRMRMIQIQQLLFP